MNQEKLNDYKLTGSIHTIAIKTDGLLDNVNDFNVNENNKVIRATSQKSGDKYISTSIINPNLLYGDIYSYSEFSNTMNVICSEAGIKEFKMIRADFRLDSFDDEHYHRYAKMNRYLISMMATQYKVKNKYKTIDLFSNQQLSIAIKNKYFELENYDKYYESDGRDNAKSRLEERAKYFDGQTLKEEFTISWFRRWEKSITDENIEKVHRKYNYSLYEIYMRDKDKYPTRFRSLDDFLLQYQDCIFCSRQLIALLTMIGEVKNPKDYAYKFKNKYRIEYFSKQDVVKAVNEIKRATIEFFER